MKGTLPKGFPPQNKSEKEYKDHETRNTLIIGFSIAFVCVFAIGWFTGMFPWIHDMGLETDRNKAQIRASVEAETSCSNLKSFVSQWEGYWDKPYAVQQAEQRMVELHC